MTCRLPAAALFAALFAALAGCAHAPSAPEPPASQPTQAGRRFWQGRLALQVESEPPQSYAASFTLSGTPEAGELHLTSPVGSTLALMRWQPGQASLQQGAQTETYASLQDMTARATGAPLPVAALFSWLRGQPQASADWHADLSRVAEGRLYARRLQPLPTAQLKVVFEP